MRVSLGLESDYYSENKEVREKRLSKKERKKLKKDLENLFNFFNRESNKNMKGIKRLWKIYEKLLEIQKELKAPKKQFNKFGNYYFRNCLIIQ